MAGIGWGTFLLFGLLDVLIVIFTTFCLKETAGKTLEEINEMFEGIDPDAEHGWKDPDFDDDAGPGCGHPDRSSYSDNAESDRMDTKSYRDKNVSTHFESIASRS